MLEPSTRGPAGVEALSSGRLLQEALNLRPGKKLRPQCAGRPQHPALAESINGLVIDAKQLGGLFHGVGQPLGRWLLYVRFNLFTHNLGNYEWKNGIAAMWVETKSPRTNPGALSARKFTKFSTFWLMLEAQRRF
jgi:hypothetical protein